MLILSTVVDAINKTFPALDVVPDCNSGASR